MDFERLGFRLVLGHVGANRRAVARGGDFPEIKHRESGAAGAVDGSVGRGGSGRREPRQGVVDLAQQAGHAGLLRQNACEQVGERWSFLFGPFRGQDSDHMGDLARQGLKLALKGLAILKKGVLGVIDSFDRFAKADDIVGDSAEVRVIGVVAEGHQDDPSVGQGGLASLAKRLVKLTPRLVLSSFPIHRARHLLNRARQRLHLVDESFDVEEQGVRARASLLTDARRLVSSLLIRVMGGSAGRLTGFGGRGAVMVENLGLVGEESLAAIGANGKREWH
jgi:hypothetical protein